MKNYKIKSILLLGLILIVLGSSFFVLQKIAEAASVIGYWNFNGNANDTSGNGNNGALQGDANVTNNYLQLDGDGDFMSIADTNDLSFGNGTSDSPFSFSAWVNANTGAMASDLPILNKMHFSGPGSDYYEYEFTVANYYGTGNLSLYLYSQNDVDTYLGRYSSRNLSNYENEWIHLVATYDGSGNSSGINLYLNGIDIDNNNDNAGSYTAMSNTAAVIRAGRYENSATYADADFDELKVYDYALSSSEVIALYEGSATSFASITVDANLYDVSDNIETQLSTAVDDTEIIIDPAESVFSGDGIKITFQSDFDISSVINANVTVSQANLGTNITKGTATVSGQDLLIPITTQSDQPWEQITIHIASNVTTPTTSGYYSITAATYDLGGDGFGGNADTLKEQGSDLIIARDVPAIPANSIVSEYQFNNSTADSTGHDLFGTLINGANYNTYGSVTSLALDIDQKQYFEVISDDVLSFGDGTTDYPFTISAWVWREEDIGTNFPIVSKGLKNSYVEYQLTWTGALGNSGPISLTLFDSGIINSARAITNDIDGFSGEWVHIVATYDGTAVINEDDAFKIYVNGQEEPLDAVNSQVSGSYAAMDNEGKNMLVGAFRHASDEIFSAYADGKIDQVRIFNYDLTSSEVENYYTNEAPSYRSATPVLTFTNTDGNIEEHTDTAIDTFSLTFYPQSNLNSGDGVRLWFESADFLANVLPADVDITQTHNTTDITPGTIVVSGNYIYIPITTQSDRLSGEVTITIDSSKITTPSVPSDYMIESSIWDLGDDNLFGGAGANSDFEESYGRSAWLVGDFDVTVTATVDPTITLTLSGNTCDFDVFDINNIRTCSYTATVATNGVNGYSAYIKENKDLTHTNDIATIDDVITITDSEITVNEINKEEYGLAVDSQDTLDVFPEYGSIGTCLSLDNQDSTSLPAEPITGTDQIFATYNVPVDGIINGKTTLCHGASITATTEAGLYSHIITITAVGNF